MTLLPLLGLLAATAAEPPPAPLAPIDANRTWEILPEPVDGDARPTLAVAAAALGDWSVGFAGLQIDAPTLIALADTRADEPLLRAVRERFRRAIDLDDFLLFLDDLVQAGGSGRAGEPFDVPAGRARAHGLLIHPDDVFKKGKPRVYGEKYSDIAVDEPVPQTEYTPAEDGALLGPEWTMRYRNPTDELEQLVGLHEKRPRKTLPSRVGALLMQLRDQGADVWLTSSIRHRERGYLMWGAFVLSRAESEAALEATAKTVEAAGPEWGLDVDIQWRHPDGWTATREAARRMADAYDVVYATEGGARYSKHYDGVAVDFVAIGLPRELTLYAPDGEVGVFDLSNPDNTRDLSLEPELIAWVQRHFQLTKLTSDYPHWNDADR
ncbi:MAG: hypothetical protein ACI8PZ_000868 [Myxococcota bacterium]|jgi:hypothetical protein